MRRLVLVAATLSSHHLVLARESKCEMWGGRRSRPNVERARADEKTLNPRVLNQDTPPKRQKKRHGPAEILAEQAGRVVAG